MGSGVASGGLSARLWLLCGALLALPGAAMAGCRADTVELRGPGGQARFTVEVADTAAERAQGLMHRESMPASAGMLFVYERPQRAGFWMKNTLIPLDMIFADPAGRVTRVHSNAVPQDETPIDGGPGVLAVLEINGGLAKRLGIVPGSELRHPALDQATAAWPCLQ
ncbi:DUF192 domain-containing protein [Paracoccaceae bacterium Fryx2]|nr:DUF192 domain-containing protein [Paracoccaceae bacterium Fryx2]